MTTTKSSAQLVTEMWQRYAQRFEAKYPGHPISMRNVSMYVINEGAERPDTHSLARWTNPGNRLNWRIPLARIPEVAKKLGATQDELDELMETRLKELAKTHPDHETIVTAAWAADYIDRTYRSRPDEEVVLACYREGTKQYPYQLFDTSKARSFLTNCFKVLADKALQGLLPEPEDDKPLNDEAEVLYRKKRAEVLTMLQAEATKKNKAEMDELTQSGIRQRNRIRKLLAGFIDAPFYSKKEVKGNRPG